MITLKITTPVIINPRTPSQLEIVFMKIISVTYTGNKYTCLLHYWWEEEVPTGRFDENNNPIMKIKKNPLSSSEVNFTRTEATAIEQFAGTLAGVNHSERFDSLIMAGTMYQLSVTPTYGLSTTGWVVV